MSSGVRQPPIRAFMDDMTITTKTVVGARWTLKELQELISWARMKFKLVKSRSLVLKKGKTQEITFKIEDEQIPTVKEKPVKSLGKAFNDTLSDRVNVQEMCRQAEEWMTTVDKCKLPGKFKAWIYQHGVLLRLLWPLLVYKVPMTTVENLERMVSSHLRRWLGVPRSLSSVALNSTSAKLQLPFKGLTEEFKVGKVRHSMMLRSSQDEMVRRARVEVRTGRKWKVKDTIQDAESRLRIGDIV